jgi:hypothetical protein
LHKEGKDRMPRDSEEVERVPSQGRTPQEILKEILIKHLDHQVDPEFALINEAVEGTAINDIMAVAEEDRE